MSLTNAPAIVTAINTMLGSSTSWTSIKGSGDTWYPNYDVRNGTLPAIVIGPPSRRREAYAAGANGVAMGELRLVLYYDTDVGTIETAGENILDDLLALAGGAGVALRSGSVGMASDPRPGARAAEEEAASPVYRYRTITIDLQYGLSV